jgi:NAD(P)-dependent dehydrogenase (short-subunit alcohol dehydrogenase family)
VLVTGCRSGFGLGIAVGAARAGYTVYAGLRDLDTGGRLREASEGLTVHPLQLDVTRPAQREAAVERILAEQGRLDALVNNAGIALGGFLEQVEEDELRRIFDVNVIGAWAMTRACLPAMRAAGGGTVVQISSMSGRMALPGLGAYAGTKFALEGLSEAWRHELRPFGIHVVLIEPGAYRTDIFGRNRTLCRHAKDPESPYAPWMEPLDRLFAKVVDRIARDPQEVVDRVLAVLQDPHPPLRVPLGPLARPRDKLRQLMPFGLMELAFSQTMRRLRRS